MRGPRQKTEDWVSTGTTSDLENLYKSPSSRTALQSNVTRVEMAAHRSVRSLEVGASTHYYFSRDNLDRDQTIRRMMIENTAVSVDKLVQAPRLASIGTTVSDLEVAIHNSNILCLVDLPDGKRGVKRYDGYPGSIAATTGVSNVANALDYKHRIPGEDGSYLSLSLDSGFAN
ncbi:unnamed protein product [Dibothriocephalus latus]|uniref:Uncharacterized protein n=1 Tax=Dibothriocephalus latus TaxID=60516 RepID=A0A3P7M0C1_DIBLA|nr:unnamed protein product [Dibothriocephalus latus]